MSLPSFRLPLLFCLLWSLSLQASPSGGPYGPVPQVYEAQAPGHQIFYVSPDGVAEREGLAPGRETTLEQAVAKARGGDLIVLRGGLYRSGDLETNQGIRLQPYADEAPVLKGSQVATGWVLQKNGLWRCAWSHLFPQKPAAWWRRESSGAKTPTYRFNNDMVFFDGRLLLAVGWEGALDANSYFIDYEAGQVYLALDPTGHQVEITAHDSALVRRLRDLHGMKSDGKGFEIRGLSFLHYAYRALEVESVEPEALADPATYGKEVVGTVLENVSIRYCSRVAAYLRGDQVVVRHCLISDTRTEGLYLLSSSDSLLEGNVFRRNNIENIDGYFPSAVKIFNQCYRTVCRDNLVVDNPHSNGIWYDVGNVEGVFVNNYVKDAQAGFFFEISKGAICAGNVFVDCQDGVKVLNSERVQILHNTFVNCPVNIERNERSAVNDHFGWHPSTGPGVEQRVGHVIEDNLFYADDHFGQPLVITRQPEAMDALLTTQAVSRFDRNVYVIEEALPNAERRLVAWAPLPGPVHRAEWASLEPLRAALPGFETGSRVLFWRQGCGFVSPRLGDFRLLPACKESLLRLPMTSTLQRLLGWPEGKAALPGAYAE